MKKFMLAVQWVMLGEVEVEAETLEEAIEKEMDSGRLPEGEYLEESYVISPGDSYEVLPEESSEVKTESFQGLNP